MERKDRRNNYYIYWRQKDNTSGAVVSTDGAALSVPDRTS